MTVFKGFLRLARRNIGIAVMYFAIFIFIAVIISKSMGTAEADSFTPSSLRVTVIDRDGGTLAQGLRDLLKQSHELVAVADDRAALQEKLFYRDTEFIVTVPAGFDRDFLTGTEKLAVTQVPGSADSMFVKEQIDAFLRDIRLLQNSGYALNEAVAKVLTNSTRAPAVTLLKGNTKTTGSEHGFYFQYLPYILLSILCYVPGMIIIAFRQQEVRRRIYCSSVPIRRQNFQLFWGYVVIGAIAWLISMLCAVILYGRDLLNDPHLALYVLNSLLLTLNALAISFLIGVIIKNEQLLSPIVNVITLGSAFICGVFVPLSVLGRGVKSVARFLPIYWYETGNTILRETIDIGGQTAADLNTGFLIQLLFAAAIFGAAVIYNKLRVREA